MATGGTEDVFFASLGCSRVLLLPPWDIGHCPEGLYYHNELTQCSSWEMPRELELKLRHLQQAYYLSTRALETPFEIPPVLEVELALREQENRFWNHVQQEPQPLYTGVLCTWSLAEIHSQPIPKSPHPACVRAGCGLHICMFVDVPSFIHLLQADRRSHVLCETPSTWIALRTLHMCSQDDTPHEKMLCDYGPDINPRDAFVKLWIGAKSPHRFNAIQKQIIATMRERDRKLAELSGPRFKDGPRFKELYNAQLHIIMKSVGTTFLVTILVSLLLLYWSSALVSQGLRNVCCLFRPSDTNLQVATELMVAIAIMISGSFFSFFQVVEVTVAAATRMAEAVNAQFPTAWAIKRAEIECRDLRLMFDMEIDMYTAKLIDINVCRAAVGFPALDATTQLLF